MNNAALLSEEDRERQTAGFFDPDVFLGETKLALILSTGLAGLEHYVDVSGREGKALLKSLTPGTELRLFREPENEHDRFAVAVYAADGTKLGFLTRFKNETTARLMDLGRVCRVFVGEPFEEPEDPVIRRRTVAPTEDYRLPLLIYLEE